MDDHNSKRATNVVNIEDIVWDILSQWKIVLICALLTALLAAGSKYIKDNNVYKAALNNQNTNEVSIEEGEDYVEKILDGLPENDRALVEYMVEQQKWLQDEMEYYTKSLLLKSDPTNQRTLILDYHISAEEPSDSNLTSLAHGYMSHLHNSSVIEGLRQVINPDIEDRYISELIITSEDETSVSKYYPRFESGDAIFSIRIVLPESVDSKAVESVVTASLKAYSDELDKFVCPNSIKLSDATEAHLYNTTAVKNKITLNANIHDIKNTYYKNMQAVLNDGQRAAINAITNYNSLKNGSLDGSSDNVERETAAKPMISKKYCVAGAVLGVIVYVMIYAAYVILTGRVRSAGSVRNYNLGKVIGEIYQNGKIKGLKKLFHSRFIEKLRYKDKLNEEKQLAKTRNVIRAICRNKNLETATIFVMPEAEKKYIDTMIAEPLRAEGISIEVSEILDEEEAMNCSKTNAIQVICEESKIKDVVDNSNLLDAFEINCVGEIYVGRVL